MTGRSASTQRVFASPLARRLARERGVALEGIRGTGPGGRIVKRDLESAPLSTQQREPTPAFAPPALARLEHPPEREPLRLADDAVVALYEPGSYDLVPHDQMRRVIAERLTLSKQTIPHFRLAIDCCVDDLVKARERLNFGAPRNQARTYKLSINDFIIKAMALALQQVPAANASWTDAGMLRHRYSDVGVAVAVEGGLYTPVIRHAELKSLSEISNEMRDLADRAKRRRLAPHEYQGGTTSISNLGMYGVTAFDAIINPPHATILAVGAVEKRPRVVGDTLAVADMMSIVLSCDHRVVDGAVGAELLAAFKSLIEDPVRMIV